MSVTNRNSSIFATLLYWKRQWATVTTWTWEMKAPEQLKKEVEWWNVFSAPWLLFTCHSSNKYSNAIKKSPTHIFSFSFCLPLFTIAAIWGNWCHLFLNQIKEISKINIFPSLLLSRRRSERFSTIFLQIFHFSRGKESANTIFVLAYTGSHLKNSGSYLHVVKSTSQWETWGRGIPEKLICDLSSLLTIEYDSCLSQEHVLIVSLSTIARIRTDKIMELWENDHNLRRFSLRNIHWTRAR